MNTKTRLLCGVLSLSSLGLLGGCQNTGSKAAAVDTFFTAYNRLCEASSLEAEGTIEFSGLETGFSAAYTSKPQAVAIKATSSGLPLASFYIRDGKTYLDYLGTRSSSVAANLGLTDDNEFHLPNPFLELSRQEREALFDSAKVEGDVYTFTFNPSKINTLLDSYGALSIEQGMLEAEIVDGQMRSVDLDLHGVYDIQSASADFDLEAEIKILAMDENVVVAFPDDLSTWGQEQSNDQ